VRRGASRLDRSTNRLRGEHSRRSSRLAAAVLVLAVATPSGFGQETPPDPARRASLSGRLAPTDHPPLPEELSQYWIVPEQSAARTSATGRAPDTALGRFARGARMIVDEDYAAGHALVRDPGLADTPVARYARYYAGVALHELDRLTEADAALTALVDDAPEGYLAEAGTLRLAAVALDLDDPARAEDLLEELSTGKPSDPADVLFRLGRAEEAQDHREHALDAYRRVYYDHPLSAQAADAQEAIERLETASLIPGDRFTIALARAERLFSARRWAQARAAFDSLSKAAQGENRTLIALRLAECDYYLDRFRASRDALRPYLDGGAREAEARFFHLTTTRALGNRTTYVSLARGLVEDHPESEWAAETLNNLATHYVVLDDDEQADRVFRELLRRFPRHRYSERAAWKVGWRAYLAGRYAEVAEIFESAASTFPRADYRPSWLYWSGRARDRAGDQQTANERYHLAATDYRNTYYGRLAMRILAPRGVPAVQPTVAPASGEDVPSPMVPTEDLIRELARLELYDDALREVEYARQAWGDSPRLEATVAWVRHQQGLSLRGMERFAALRGAINTMRRAYPQFMAAGGEDLPPDVLRIIFPLDYWTLIRKYSDLHRLDPYLIAALMAQESTFTPEIRSSANAYGLMQIIPATGRQLARTLGIRRFATSMLTQPETNVRMGTKYFKDMLDRFGGAHFALAGYNAGPHRVVDWLKETPGLAQDEFIDNIPFPETQNYVKRILGTAEDYRRLYGPDGVLDPNARLARSTVGDRASSTLPAPSTTRRSARAR
jgi:soluble lytic murein transglycosylase